MMLIKSRILAKDNRSRRGKNGTHARLKRISYPNIIDSKLKGFKGASRRNIRLKIFERYRSIVEIIREESEVARLLPPMEISLEDTRGDTRYTRRVEVILPYTNSRGEIVEETQRQRPFLLLAEATHDDLDRARETSSLEVASDRLRSRVDNEYRYIYINILDVFQRPTVVQRKKKETISIPIESSIVLERISKRGEILIEIPRYFTISIFFSFFFSFIFHPLALRNGTTSNTEFYRVTFATDKTVARFARISSPSGWS